MRSQNSPKTSPAPRAAEGEGRAALGATPGASFDGIVALDSRGAVRSINDEAAALFGYAAEEILGRDFGMLTPESDLSFRDHLGKTPSLRRRIDGLRKDGSVLPMELDVSEVVCDGERLFIGLIRDLGQRRFERDIQKLQANRLDLIENMAAGLAHELKQPLTAIGVYLNFARRYLNEKDLSVQKIAETLDNADAQVFRASQIMDNLRQFIARGETTKTPQNLNPVIRTACAFTDSLAKLHNVKTTINLDASPDIVLINKVQIQQVVVNLKRNAVEAMQNCARREMRVSTGLIDGDLIRADVADTGPGLPDEVKDRLFEQFTTTKPHGLGVGLSISRSIIEAHNGKIWAEPNPGGGTIFSFALPLAAR
ncbi:MAG: nitrogen regulation protein NR(II) [Methylocystis sp.]|uniref:two-component system sensor histidine kinase NtrB n=1 Tax=Methylocystis sp. TaxID=1911079 RepID=UPI003D1261C8